jgi:hypothetical protein
MHSNNEPKPELTPSEAWRQRLQTTGPEPCPTCGHVPQLRYHVFTVTMALALIHLYHRGEPAPEEMIPEIVKTGESLKKLALWGYVDEREGAYTLTKVGLEVVLKREPVPKALTTASGVPMWHSAETALIDEVLRQRYSYDSLMEAPAA